MTSDVTCLETYQNMKTMHCSKTWINLHRFLDFANTCILPKTCPAPSWDQTLLSFSWVKRFQAGKQAAQYPRQIDKHASNGSDTKSKNNERNEVQVFNFQDLYKLKLKSIVISSTHYFRTLAFLLALLHLSRTSTHAAIRSVSTGKKADHSHTMHISWKNNGILRTDREISRYTVHTVTKVPLTKSRLGCGLLLSPAKSINGWLTRHQLL